MARSFVRLKQPAITNVLPHAQNSKWAVNKKRIVNLFNTPVIFAGDSLMAGIDGYQTGIYEAYADYVPSLPRLQQFNEASGGRHLQQIADALPASIDANPTATAVIFNGGVNDLVQDRTLEQMQSAFTQILTICEANGLPVMYVSIAPNGQSTGWTPERFAQRNEFDYWAQAQIFDRGRSKPSKFKYADIYAATVDSDGISLRAEFAADPTHMNADGCSQVGRIISNSSFTGYAGEAAKNPPGTKYGYQFNTNQYFLCDTFQIDPSTFNGMIRTDWTLTSNAANNDTWGTGGATYARLRTGQDFRVFFGGTGGNAVGPSWPLNTRFTALYDFSTPLQCEVSVDGGAAASITVGNAAGAAALAFGDRPGGVGATGILWKFEVLDNLGAPIHTFNLDEGSGVETFSEQGERAALIGAPGSWVIE